MAYTIRYKIPHAVMVGSLGNFSCEDMLVVKARYVIFKIVNVPWIT